MVKSKTSVPQFGEMKKVCTFALHFRMGKEVFTN
jgi:hypothetical protein